MPTIDAQRYVGGLFAVWEHQWCPQYCRHKCRRLQYCRHKCRYLPYCLCQVGCGVLFPQAYRVWSWYRVLTLCATFSVHPWSLPSGNPGRMAPVGTGRASRRRTVSRLTTSLRSETRGWSRKQRFGPGLPIGESARRRPAPEASAPVEEVAEEVVERAFVLSVDLPVGDRSVPPARCFLDFFGPAHELQVVLLGRARASKPVPEGPRVYEPDTLPIKNKLNNKGKIRSLRVAMSNFLPVTVIGCVLRWT